MQINRLEGQKMINITALSPDAYYEVLRKLLTAAETDEPLPHVDPIGKSTIGSGFNMSKLLSAVSPHLPHHAYRLVALLWMVGALTAFIPTVVLASSQDARQDRNECPGRVNVQAAADCVESGQYLPCELANRTGTLDCAWAYSEVAERNAKKTEQKIVDVLRKREAGKKDVDAFRRWQEQWTKFRAAHCALSDRLIEVAIKGQPGIVAGGTEMHRGFCFRRLTEARLAELERFFEISVLDK
jgi:uncharacterized protein YecT (DUF1311 family)